MKTFKAVLVLILIYVILTFAFLSTGMFELEGISLASDYARITDVDYKATILDNEAGGGKALIKEIITFDVHAASQDNPFWELWRDLPEDTIDGLDVDYEVLSVFEIDESGNKIQWEESDKLYWYDEDYISKEYGPGKWYHSEGPYNDYDRFECLLFYVDGIYREKITFEITYIMNNAAFKYADVSELYLSMFSGDDTKHLKSYKGQILFENKDMPKQGNYTISTYGTTNHRFEFKESKTMNPGYHTIYFELDEEDLKFNNDNNYIEMTMLSYGDDKHAFTHFAPDNIYSDEVYLEEALENIVEYDNQYKNAIKSKNRIFIYTSLATLVILIITLRKKITIKKKYTIYTSTLNAEYFRDIPSDLDPFFASALVFCKENKQPDLGETLSALLLSLTRKGYIELKQIDPTKKWTQDNIEINVLYSPMTISLMARQEMNKAQINHIIEQQRNNINAIKENKPYNAQEIKPILNVQNTNKYGKAFDNLTPNEKEYFNLILKYAIGNKLTMDNFQTKISKDYDNADSFLTKVKKSVKEIGMKNNYFQKADYDEISKNIRTTANTILTIGLCVMIIGNLLTFDNNLNMVYGIFTVFGIVSILCNIYLKKEAPKYILLTQIGEDEYIKWRGLYNFLNSKTLMNEKTVIDVVLWEKYLVYATAFGISEKVIKALEIACPNIQPTQSIMLSNSYYRSTSFRTYNHSFARRTTTASNTSRSSRYSGGGYYGGGGSFYGGGGRGGGGGGGGH